MKAFLLVIALIAASVASADPGEEMHSHPAPERLGKVEFPTSCSAAVQHDFERAVALLHSFTYELSADAFRSVIRRDPSCAMAHWGVAMTQYHQLWNLPSAAEMQIGRQETDKARQLQVRTDREREFIAAAAAYFGGGDDTPVAARAQAYQQAMALLATHNPSDTEAQVFYALALIGTALPTDRSHSNQKRAAAILEPIFRAQPQHPGVAHYLIHACDSTELAPQGLAAARAYSKIAPSAPHALHMPSHIFTRLGLWNDSIASNKAARDAAHSQHDLGEELHAMDYLTYAYLQEGRFTQARQVVADLRSMGPMVRGDFKVEYAATAMPVRLAMEQRHWSEAERLEPLAKTPPHETAMVYWARAVARSRAGHGGTADRDIESIDRCLTESKGSGEMYWSRQIEVLGKEARAWQAAAAGKGADAVQLMQQAADIEDSLEKLPVTPGPIIPAREQLGELLLELHRPSDALRELKTALLSAPGRRGALAAVATAEHTQG